MPPSPADPQVFRQVEQVFANKKRAVAATGSSSRIGTMRRAVARKTSSPPGLRLRNAFLLALSVKKWVWLLNIESFTSFSSFKCSKEALVRRIDGAEWESAPLHHWKSLKESFPSSDEASLVISRLLGLLIGRR